MTTALQDLHGPGDAALIAAVRDGDSDAYGLLFERHVGAARRLAGQLLPGPDADDLVSEAFAKVLVVLQRGGGPDLAFRAYLLTAVRRLHVDRVRTVARVRPTDDLTPFDPGVPFHDSAVAGFESGAAARAFASLPERWQLVLWHTEVEDQKPAEVAVLLDMAPNAVSALAYRAREGLREAFLAMHVAPEGLPDAACAPTRALLGGYVRGGMSRRDTTRVESHLATCRPCAAIHLELTEVNDQLAGLLAPALLGAAAAAYVSSGSGALGTVGIVVAVLDRAKDVVVAHSVSSSVAGAAATAVIGGAVVVAEPPDLEPPTAVEAPPTQTQEPEPQPPSAPAGPDEAVRPEPTPDAATLPPAATTPTAEPSPLPPTQSSVEPSPEAGADLSESPSGSPSESPSEAASGDAADMEGAEPAPDTETDLGTDPEAEPVAVDVGLSTEVEQSGDGATTIRVTVTGLPEGRTATLTSRGERVVAARTLDPRCRIDGTADGACAVGNGPETFQFRVNAPESGRVTFTVALDGDDPDPDPSDNTVRLAVS